MRYVEMETREDYLTSVQCAQLMGVSTTRIFQAEKEGRFPKRAYKEARYGNTGQVFWRRSDVLDFLKARQVISEMKKELSEMKKELSEVEDKPKERMLRRREVLTISGLSSSQLYRLMAKGAFPRRYKLSENGTGWKESEVNDWINTRTPKGGLTTTHTKRSRKDMATDWIKFNLGKEWGDGNGDDIFVRISMIQAIFPNTEVEGESQIYLMVDNAFDVKGTPKEIMEMINART